jgi:CheY-like chemotaxis protein
MNKESILVVEDELLVGLEIKEDLERLGYEVPEVVASAEGAMAAVSRHKPSLVVMDVRIEGSIDGIDTAFLLKSEFDVPVLYLTAFSDAATLQRAAATGPDAYLLKPFDERELAANVAMILAKSRAGGSAKASLRASIPLTEALEQPAILVDLDGYIVHANRKATGLLGSGGGKALRGEALSRFLSPLEAGEEEGPDQGLSRIKAWDGSPVGMASRLEPVIREDGTRIGDIVTFDRMSARERSHLESSVDAINRTLEALVPAATALGPAFRVEGFLLPCTSGAGDILDAFRLDPRTSAFHGLDVMGHGTLASLVAYSLHSMVRDLARQRDDNGGFGSAASLVRRLNERYSGSDSGKPFFTMTYGMVDGETGDFHLARAGHPPALLLPAKGRCEMLETRGGAVGVIEELEVEEASGRLDHGDRLVLASDGFLEGAFGVDLGKSLEDLRAFLEAQRSLGLEALGKTLRQLVLQRSPLAGLRDDASLLVVERA